MAAPTPTARVSPTGRKLGDGYQCLITFSGDTDASFWEISVTPPAVDGGEPNDTTTMHNTTWRTKSARALLDMQPFDVVAGYDPALYTTILTNLINNDMTITITFPDRSTLAFYGYLQSFAPDALEEGTMPQATLTIVPTNQDPTDCTEESPVYTAGTGTAPC